MRLSRIISSLQRSDLLKGQDIPPFPIPIEHIRSLVRDQMIELEKPDPVKEALESTDSLEGLGGDVAQTGPVDEDEVATFYRLVGDKFGGMSRDSDEFREMMERAIPAFRGRPAPPLEREDEW